MGRIDYLGKSFADLGVSLPGQPPLRRGASYGVRFPGGGLRGTPFGAPDSETVDVEKDRGADLLVLLPGEFDDDDEALVVITNTRCLRTPRLVSELSHLTSASPDSPSARIYVPEKHPGDTHLRDGLQQRVDDAAIMAEVFPFYPSP